MPVYQELIDLDTMLTQLTEQPIIINDLVNNSEEDKEAIKELITTRYSSDMITLLPSCRCGITKGEFTAKGPGSVGVTCEYCGTLVQSSIESDIEPTVWFRKPNGVAPLINPALWIMLKLRFKKSGFNIIQWLTDTTYRPQVKQPTVVNKIVEAGIQRGYNNFYDNFDQIMSFLFSLRDFKKEGPDYLQELIARYRGILFSDYIPIPNKSLLIIEKTNVGVYVDPIIIEAVDAIHLLVSIDKDFHDQNPRVKENRTAKALSKLSDFHEKFYKLNLSPKAGQFRRHIFGTRTNFSFRAVITSLTDTYDYDEIHVPWAVGLSAFEPHMLNKLLKMGMDINSAKGLLLGHIEKYNEMLDGFLKELVSEAPNQAIYCILQRNPSLLQGSAQRVRLTKFKTDPADHTISLHISIVKSFNADKIHCRLI